MKPRKRQKALKPIHPSAALRTAYQRKLEAAVEAMHKSVAYWVLVSYRKTPPVLAQDEAPLTMFKRQMKKLRNRWLGEFDTLSEKMAAYFATEASKRVDGAMAAMLRDHGMSVQFTMTAAQREAINATTAENVGLIRSIAEKHLGDVEGIVLRSINEGRNLANVSKQLQQQFGVTKRRAALIARHQNNMATATLVRVRQVELGITTAKWSHSAGGKHPRPEHVAANGKTYDVRKGMFLEGKWTWPGREINCRCVSISVIDGFIE